MLDVLNTLGMSNTVIRLRQTYSYRRNDSHVFPDVGYHKNLYIAENVSFNSSGLFMDKILPVIIKLSSP